MEGIERFFRLRENSTTLRSEVRGGLTTFATMSYIIFVQPAVLSAAGMDFGAVMVATCLASALATLLMGLLANYPIALAPAMGHNFFFVFTVVLAMGIPWQKALGAVFISGAVFIGVSFFGLRERVIESVPDSLKHGIAVGIGLLIALVGLEWAGIVVDAPGTLVGLGDLGNPPVLLSIFGLATMAVLMAMKVRGAILIGMLASICAGIPFGLVEFRGVLDAPPSLAPTFLKLDVRGAMDLGLLTIVFVFFFLDLFDTVGTLIGVGEQAGFIRNGKLPGAKKALLSDAIGTVAGALLGTSTVTSYIESAAGISEGARTGLANMVVAGLFMVALFFQPLVQMIGGGYEAEGGLRLYPVIAPALVLVGGMMFRSATRIKWEDPTEGIPAFLALITMPVTFSITEGIAFAFISCSALKTATGRAREVSLLVHVFALLFLLRYIFISA